MHFFSEDSARRALAEMDGQVTFEQYTIRFLQMLLVFLMEKILVMILLLMLIFS